MCLNTLRAGLIASRIDLTTELYPGVLAAPLIIGSIAGTGGRFSIDPILSGFGALEGSVLGYLSASLYHTDEALALFPANYTCN